MAVNRGDIREDSITEPLLPGPGGGQWRRRQEQQEQQQQQQPSSFPSSISPSKDAMSRIKTVQSSPDLVESLDYEIIESGLYRDYLVKRTPSEQFLYYSLRWIFALLIGVSTGLIAFIINLSVENISGHKFMRTTNLIASHGPFVAFLFYTSVNVGLIFIASYLCAFIAPAAGGSGIPEVKAYLNGIDTPHIMSMKTFAVKVLGSIGSVAGGLAVGKEGPLVHTGACVASILGQGGSRKYHLTWKWLRLYKNDRDRRDLVSCGAAAGVAAAFRAPVGGVLFALEEAATWWRSTLLWRAFFTTAVVAVVVREAMEWCKSDRCGVFGGGGFIIFDISGSYINFGLKELVPVVVIGVVGGVLGTLFNAINEKITIWRRDLLGKDYPWIRVAEVCLVALATSIVSFWVPWLGPCKECPANENFICPSAEHIGNFKQFHCPDGHYSDTAGLLFSTFDDAIRNLFKVQSHSDFSFHALFIFNFSFFFLAVCTYGTMVPSGLFVPAILNGATYGRAVGMVMKKYYGAESQIDEGTYAVLGAASFLGGSMRMTVALCIILLEMTGQTKVLPLVMLVLLISKTIGDNFNEAIYDIHLRLKRIPFLDARPDEFMRHLRARDCISTKLVSFSAVEKVGTIYETLATYPYNSFPVHEILPNGQSSFQGLVLRNHLLVLLKSKKSFQESSRSEPERHKRAITSHTLIDFGKPGTGRGMTLDQISLDDVEMNMYIDLHLFVNSSPYSVSENMMLSKVYTLFRQLGLRHLCVVPKPSKIVGIITRKDLLPEVFEDRKLNHHRLHKESFVC